MVLHLRNIPNSHVIMCVYLQPPYKGLIIVRVNFSIQKNMNNFSVLIVGELIVCMGFDLPKTGSIWCDDENSNKLPVSCLS